MPDSPPAITDAHINRFRQRARFHFGVSYVILIGVLGLFGFAIYVFLFAQEIDRSKGSIEILQELQIGKADQTLVLEFAQDEADFATQRLREGTIDLLSVLNAVPALGEART